MIKYLVLFEKTKTGYSAYAPDLPGCIATGKTKNDAEKNMFEAIKFHLEGLRENGDEIPNPNTESEFFVLG